MQCEAGRAFLRHSCGAVVLWCSPLAAVVTSIGGVGSVLLRAPALGRCVLCRSELPHLASPAYARGMWHAPPHAGPSAIGMCHLEVEVRKVPSFVQPREQFFFCFETKIFSRNALHSSGGSAGHLLSLAVRSLPFPHPIRSPPLFLIQAVFSGGGGMASERQSCVHYNSLGKSIESLGCCARSYVRIPHGFPSGVRRTMDEL
eukprot:scaffold15830_cov90-Isochrysis_galbana.AAC.3